MDGQTGQKMSLKIYAVQKTQILSDKKPGHIQVVSGASLLVHSTVYVHDVLEQHLQGKKRTRIQDFIRGYTVSTGMHFTRD